MNKMNLYEYHENKTHVVKLMMWRLLNLVFFLWCGNRFRQLLLRMFGAQIGRGCLICRGVKVYAPWNLQMGEMVCIGPNVELYNKDCVTIGSGVIVSQDSYLCTASHDITTSTMALKTKPITIGDNVWIAAKVSVAPGVVFGEGAVAALSSVVVKNVEPWTVVGGNPAQVVKKRSLVE